MLDAPTTVEASTLFSRNLVEESHLPPRFLDCIIKVHLGRTTLVWSLWLVVSVHTSLLCTLWAPRLTHGARFALTLGFLPGRRISLLAATVTYLVFLVVSVIPEFVAKLMGPALDSGDPFVIELFLLYHLVVFTPAITLLCLCGVVLQAREVVSRPPGLPSPLSKTGLRLQAVVFSIMAILWLVELPSPQGRLD